MSILAISSIYTYKSKTNDLRIFTLKKWIMVGKFIGLKNIKKNLFFL